MDNPWAGGVGSGGVASGEGLARSPSQGGTRNRHALNHQKQDRRNEIVELKLGETHVVFTETNSSTAPIKAKPART